MHKGGNGWKVAQPSDAMLRGTWWKIFRDPELNSLEDQLEINNQNIKQSFQNFMEARALVGEANSQLYPTLTANASYLRSFNGSSGGSGGSSSAASGIAGAAGVAASASPITSIMTALNLSWEPDLWGRIRNEVRAAQYNAQVSAADLQNERLTEESSLAVYFFELRGQDALQKLYNDSIEAYKKSLAYTQAQYETGITDQIAVFEATNTLQNAEATATNLGVLRAQYEHAIAVLIGRVRVKFRDADQVSYRKSPARSDWPAIPTHRAAPRRRCLRTRHGRRQRSDRHGRGRLLSHRYAGRGRRLRE